VSELMTMSELAQYLRFTRQTIYKLLKQREIPAIKINRKWRFDKEQIDNWLKNSVRRDSHRILVVDDEPVIGELFKRSLVEPDYIVTTLTSSVKALELLKTDKFNLIFLDLKMPDIDGAELFRQIREIDKNVPVSIITGFPDSELMVKAMEFGPFMVLKKPFVDDDILNTVHSFAEGMATTRRV
jgi:excisionase family DNA binding protein